MDGSEAVSDCVWCLEERTKLLGLINALNGSTTRAFSSFSFLSDEVKLQFINLDSEIDGLSIV